MKRNEHLRKMAAPIVITLLFLAYLVFYAVFVAMTVDTAAAVLLAVPLLALGVGMVVVLKERIREIRSGEEDDLGNY